MEKTIGAVKISSFHCPEKGADSRRGIRKPVAFEGLYVTPCVWFCIVWLPYKPHYCRCKAALGQKSHWASPIVTAMGSFLTGIAFIANSAESSTVTATAAQILLLTPAPPLTRLPSDCPLYSATSLTFCQLEHQIKVIISFLMLTVLTLELNLLPRLLNW